VRSSEANFADFSAVRSSGANFADFSAVRSSGANFADFSAVRFSEVNFEDFLQCVPAGLLSGEQHPPLLRDQPHSRHRSGEVRVCTAVLAL
jgi:hypothetical protein